MKRIWVVEAADIGGQMFRGDPVTTKEAAIISAKSWLEQGSPSVVVREMRLSTDGILFDVPRK